MKVIMNGEQRTVPENINIEKLLEHLELAGQQVAIELNNNVVRRKDWPETAIAESDKIEIVHFVGGG